MAEMRTEAAILNQQAAKFDSIASGLGQERTAVDNVGNGFKGSWQGQAATAAAGALQRFDEAINAQINELHGIVENLNRSGANYTKADEEAQQSLSSKMNF
ncbi:WXG100 family type VII secretion target [Mycobacterium haemophilum]|uniref:ESAT-6-like protein n=1 Tax=Mycobacterium haemophilum TaxID=29311 RepID=A0A0I9TC90_9MYCO|nr:WXG100 family type VII secretion target [Mycobacterium haemophilum]KLO25525.1 type VII secretion protein EsxB [Mycobacterium haemophilum]KLO34085.1 type VII secretion protein EsxB [Mycobacterium haemophilum]KLO35905.1 type VII secretion protein EsxB [Mycobacterium haemophilum]KLO43862.1 type VII secretion protein EsxB [Mycobacterium haemophilum]